MARRLITNMGNKEEALQHHREVVSSAQYDLVLQWGVTGVRRVFTPKEPPLPAGDPRGASGVMVSASELDPDLIGRLEALEAAVGVSGEAAAVKSVQEFIIAAPVPSAFALSFAPFDPSDTEVMLQGVGMRYGLTGDYHVDGSVLHWHSGVVLSPGDVLTVSYFHMP